MSTFMVEMLCYGFLCLASLMYGRILYSRRRHQQQRNVKGTETSIVLILGGCAFRELHGCAFVPPGSDVWVLSPAKKYLDYYPIPVKLRLESVDTVTNFTCHMDELISYSKVTIVTCAGHARRVRWISRWLFWTYGIREYQILCVENHICKAVGPEGESVVRVGRDVLRCVLWSATGWNGSWWTGLYHPTRTSIRT
eukprot:PhF_6_TR5775/c0_g1_i3/m.8526